MQPQSRLGDNSTVPVDAHGNLCCPHECIGPAISGSLDVFVNARPALRVTDTGIHAACCGPNTWIATKGSTSVFINNLAAHRLYDEDMHCGGPGYMVEASEDVFVGDMSVSGLFDILKKLDIPFDYPVDCCYARADKMARVMKSLGVDSQKYWLFAQNWGEPGATPDLAPTANGAPVMFPNAHTGAMQPVSWVYHVAPMVTVTNPDGSTQKYILDPSIASGPVTPEQWAAIQGNPAGAYPEVSSSDSYFQNQKHGIDEPADAAKTDAQLQKHRESRDAANAAAASSAPSGASGF